MADQLPHRAEDPGESSSGVRLRRALTALRDQLGYDTACLYASGAEGHWYLVERRGPLRPWHAVLDPDVIDAFRSEGDHPDVRLIPGVGMRLAELGCGRVRVLAVDGARLLLDGAAAKRGEATEPDPALLGQLVECWQGVAGSASATRGDDVAALDRVASTVRRLLETPWPTVEDLLSAVRVHIEADRLVLVLCSVGGGVEILSTDRRPSPVNAESLRTALEHLDEADPISQETVGRLARLFGITTSHAAAAWCDPVTRRELLIASWATEPTVSEEGLGLLARLLSIFVVSVRVRRRLVDAQVARERQRWIQDIHDGVTQAATAAVIELENLRGTITVDPERAAASLDEVQQHIREALAELREIITGDMVEAPTRPRPSLQELIAEVAGRWRLPSRISVTGEVDSLPDLVIAAAHAIVREALANAAKYSKAKVVDVRAAAENDGLSLHIRDTGCGFDVASSEGAQPSLGLRLMKQRATEVGGTVEVTSTPGHGTSVRAFLPRVSPRVGDDADPIAGLGA